jgi:hypothetical protein
MCLVGLFVVFGLFICLFVSFFRSLVGWSMCLVCLFVCFVLSFVGRLVDVFVWFVCLFVCLFRSFVRW